MYADIPEGDEWTIDVTVTDRNGPSSVATVSNVWYVDGTYLDDDEDDDIDGVEDAADPYCSPDMLTRHGTYYGDCDDTDPSANPGETERCDGVDNDCDGYVNERIGTMNLFPPHRRT